ncbi:MAG: hypothetical protein JSR33_00400 [Proteobacteria bacterium]|nr:hypothetical protein [Pseudomonadota bacterium]
MTNSWTMILSALAAIILIWLLVRTVRTNPEAFNKENFGKSAYTIGLLTLIIIAVIVFCVAILRSS